MVSCGKWKTCNSVNFSSTVYDGNAPTPIGFFRYFRQFFDFCVVQEVVHIYNHRRYTISLTTTPQLGYFFLVGIARQTENLKLVDLLLNCIRCKQACPHGNFQMFQIIFQLLGCLVSSARLFATAPMSRYTCNHSWRPSTQHFSNASAWKRMKYNTETISSIDAQMHSNNAAGRQRQAIREHRPQENKPTTNKGIPPGRDN